MKARPILMSTPMVQALLEGRKTQTRRILKNKPNAQDLKLVPELLRGDAGGACSLYGKVGDLLWVRETFGIHYEGADTVIYKADNSVQGNWELYKGWKPSIFMPKWASRLNMILRLLKQR